jgi:hypothetical protein
MNFRFLRRASGRALLVGGMTLGLTGAAATVASAASPQTNNWYVSTTGSDTGNACANSSTPCATITHALLEQSLTGLPGTIHVAAGTYAETVSASTVNDGVTIQGAGTTTTIIQPSAAEITTESGAPYGDTDSSTPQIAVVAVNPGTTGFGLKKLTVSGTAGSPALDTDGDACGQDYIGIYYYESSGSITKVDVNGINMPVDLYGCQGGQGIYVNSDSADPSNVSMSGVGLLSPSVTTKTTAKLLAGTYNNDVLPVTAVPNGFHSGEVAVGGYDVSATKDGHTALFITGTVPGAVKKGSTVAFNIDSGAFDKNGITCDDQYTTCSIKGSTIQGDGPQNGIAQNGVQFFGTGSATLNGTTVTGDTWTGGGGAGNAASGVLVLNVGTLNVGTTSANTVTDSDVNLYLGEVPAYGLATTAGTWIASNNNISGATSDGQSAGEGGYGEGIQLDGTTNNVDLYNNTVTTSPQANFLLLGVENATIGGTGAGQGNTSVGSPGAGTVVGGPSTECEVVAGGNVPSTNCNYGTGAPESQTPGWASYGNSISGNTYNENAAGVVVEGAFAPTFQGLSPDPNAAYGNTFDGNTWSGTGISNALAGVADFSGNADAPPAENTYGTGASANSCTPSPGGSALVNAIGGPAATVTGNVVTSGSPTVTNSTAYPATVIQGALVVDTTTSGNIAAGTYVSSVSGTTLTLTQNAAGSGANDTLNFYNKWAC